MKKNLKILAEEYIASGHRVTYRKRKDGGYIITSIDNKKYRAGEGNKALREATGAKLSAKQRIGLKKATRAHKAKTPRLNKKVEKKLSKTQRTWRKTPPAQIGEKARISKKRIRKVVAIEGKEKALEILDKAERYAKHISYVENVEALISRINRITISPLTNYSASWRKIANIIERRKNNFKEDVLNAIYEILYEVEKAEGDSAIEQKAITEINIILTMNR